MLFFASELLYRRQGLLIIIIITAFVQRHKVRRYRGAGGVRLRLSEKIGLEVSFEGVHSTAGSVGLHSVHSTFVTDSNMFVDV